MTVLGRIFHQGCERRMSPLGAAIGLAAGALTGGMLTGLAWAVATAPTGGLPAVVFAVELVLPIATMVWGAGLVVVGLPGWLVLHLLGARCQQAAMLYGGGLGVAAGALIGAAGNGFAAPSLVAGVFLGIAGVLVGWVVAKVAYAPVKP